MPDVTPAAVPSAPSPSPPSAFFESPAPVGGGAGARRACQAVEHVRDPWRPRRPGAGPRGRRLPLPVARRIPHRGAASRAGPSILTYNRAEGLGFASPTARQHFEDRLRAYDAVHGTSWADRLPRDAAEQLRAARLLLPALRVALAGAAGRPPAAVRGDDRPRRRDLQPRPRGPHRPGLSPQVVAGPGAARQEHHRRPGHREPGRARPQAAALARHAGGRDRPA